MASTQEQFQQAIKHSRYRFGDRVRAVVTSSYDGDFWHLPRSYAKGEEVEGVIINCVNSDPSNLIAGEVEIRLDEGHRMWVRAIQVITPKHNLREIETVRRYVWKCDRCSERGVEESHAQAEAAFAEHEKRAESL